MQRTRDQARARGGSPGPEASIAKLFTSNVCMLSQDLIFQILGAEGLLWGESAPKNGEYVTIALASLGTHIGGGTDEIQRNSIGERVLGLPREPNQPDSQRGIPNGSTSSILIAMNVEMTTIKVTTRTRDELRSFAEGETLEAALRRLLRQARQRRMGEELAAVELTDDERAAERAWIDIGIRSAAEEHQPRAAINASR